MTEGHPTGTPVKEPASSHSSAGSGASNSYSEMHSNSSTQSRLTRQFAAVCELTTRIDTASPDPSPSLRLVVQIAADALMVDRVSIWMVNSVRKVVECLDQFVREERRHLSAASLSEATFLLHASAGSHPERVYSVDSILDGPADNAPNNQIATRETSSGSDFYPARIVVPILLRGQTVGYLTFEDSNLPRQWQVDELSFAVVLSDLVARMLELSEARRGEAELVYRLRFEELLTSLALLFINLSAESVDEGINHALGEIGRFSGADHCYILYSSDNMLTVSNTHEWCSPGADSFKDQLQRITPAYFPWLFKQLTEFDSVKIDRLDELPPEAGAERSHLVTSGARSLIMIPLVSSGHRVGCLGLDTVRRERTWNDGDISFLRIVGEMFVNALDRKRSETQIKEQQEFFRKVIDLDPNFIFAKDRDLKFTLVNQAVADAYGTTVDGIVGKTDADFNPNEEQVEWFRRDDLEVIDQKVRKYIAEEKITDASGKTRWLQTVKIPIEDADGRVNHLLGVATDITQRKHYEEEQRRLEAQIQHTQKLESLGVLAGGIAHDFNNLLMGVLGNAGLALMEILPESPVKSRIEQIKIAAKRASELTNQLLAYSGKGKFVVGPLDLNQLVGEMTALLETIISKKASLQLNLSPNADPIEADATQLRQVVMNLITNASDALGEAPGSISVSTGLLRLVRRDFADYLLKENLKEGSYSYLQISDTGCGMDAESLQKIFDPFYSTKFTGRGLGLAAVIGIVRSHRGTLSVESAPGRGTTFRILFPTVAEAPKTAPSETRAAVRSDGKNGIFLVVDDEETTRAVAAEMLSHFGYEILTANDGREGVEMFKKHSDKLVGVLLDMTMPILDGEEALREMLKIRRDIPFILSSGYCEQDITARFERQCFVGFIQKPYGPIALQKVVNELRDRAGK